WRKLLGRGNEVQGRGNLPRPADAVARKENSDVVLRGLNMTDHAEPLLDPRVQVDAVGVAQAGEVPVQQWFHGLDELFRQVVHSTIQWGSGCELAHEFAEAVSQRLGAGAVGQEA